VTRKGLNTRGDKSAIKQKAKSAIQSKNVLLFVVRVSNLIVVTLLFASKQMRNETIGANNIKQGMM
jgi:hypothetical protein